MISVRIDIVMAIQPPLPIPETALPTSNKVKLLAIEHITSPIVKEHKANMRIHRRPKTSENWAVRGWTIALANIYDVPVQNTSVTLP